MKKTLASILIAAAVAGGPAQAAAASIGLRTDAKAPELPVAEAEYAGFLRSHPGTRLETAEVDLNGDRVAEVAVRFVGKDTCDGDECSSAVLMHFPSGWKQIFSHHAKTLETVPAPGGMDGLVVDGAIRWSWNGTGTYTPVLSSFGRVAAAPSPADVRLAAAAAKALDANLADGRWFSSEIQTLIPGGKSYLVTTDARSMCGSMGCRAVLLVPKGAGWAPAMKTITAGAVAAMPSSTLGVQDLAFADPMGIEIWKWDGSEYRLAGTSFPSSVTPAP